MLGDNENIKKHIQAIKNSGPLKQCGTRLVAFLICMSVPTMLCRLPDLSEQPPRRALGNKVKGSWALVGQWGTREKHGGLGREVLHHGD